LAKEENKRKPWIKENNKNEKFSQEMKDEEQRKKDMLRF
jgi:hypothetical protein